MLRIIENQNLKFRILTLIFFFFLLNFTYGQKKEIFVKSVLISDESIFKDFNSINLEIKSIRSSNTIYKIDTLKNFHFELDSASELYFSVDSFLLIIDKPFLLLEDSMVQKWTINIKNRSECTMVGFGCFGSTYDYSPLCSIGKRELNLITFDCSISDEYSNERLRNEFKDIKNYR